MTWYRYEKDALIVRLYVQPGAKHNEVVGVIQDELKIKLRSPPIDGRANTALNKYLSKLFQVPLSHLQLKVGAKSRHKTMEIRKSTIHPECLLPAQ